MDVRRNRRQQMIREAEGYLELGMHQHVLAALDRLGTAHDLEAHVAYLKGEALRSLDRYAEAVIELRRAADSTPEDIHAWLALGWCYKRTGRIHLAIRALDQALRYEPGEALVHYNLACYWSLAGNKHQALQYLSTAFDIDTKYRYLVDNESDFDPIRDDPDFQAITTVIV